MHWFGAVKLAKSWGDIKLNMAVAGTRSRPCSQPRVGVTSNSTWQLQAAVGGRVAGQELRLYQTLHGRYGHPFEAL
jgi:hypothetical protein